MITANKEMFAHHGQELLSLAKDHHVSVGFEATVGGGIPVIQTLRKLLNINTVTKVEGIINGTSNFILTSMREEGLPFEETLAIAQEKGYAEADPTNDIEGYDAYYKALVLSNVVFGELPEKEDIVRKGIIKYYTRTNSNSCFFRFEIQTCREIGEASMVRFNVKYSLYLFLFHILFIVLKECKMPFPLMQILLAISH